MRESSSHLTKLTLVPLVFLLLIAGAFSLLPSRSIAQSSPTVTGVGPWTQQGNYGSSSTTPGQGGVSTLGASCVIYSGDVYCVGGQNPSGTDLSDVFYAKLSSSGSIGAWAETTDYGATTGSSGTGGVGIEWPSCVESSGYVYCVAGATTGGSIISKVYFAQLSSSGVGPWTETVDYGVATGSSGSGGLSAFQLACVADSGYVYCVGGGAGSKVFYAQLTSSGIGPWTETTDYGAASGSTGSGGIPIDSNACVDDNGSIYCIGGTSTSFAVVSDVFSAPLSSSGVGAWTENTDYGAASGSSGTGGEPIYGASCAVYASFVICIGGDTTGHAGTAHIFYGKDGQILGWKQTEDYVVSTYWDDCVEFDGYVYCWGQGDPNVYSSPIDTSSTTSTSSSSTSTTSTTTTSTTTTTTTSGVNPTTISTLFTPGAAFAGYQQITAGTPTADGAVFTAPVPPPRPTGGTVTYYSYSGPNCTGTKTVLDTVNVQPSSQIPSAPDLTFNTPGDYYFSAHYSGDPTDSPADSTCEKLVVVPATGTTTSNTSTGTGVTPPNNDVLIGVGAIVIVAAAGGFILWTRTRKGKVPPPPPPPPPPPTQPTPPLVVAPPLVITGRKPCPPDAEPMTSVTDCCEVDIYLEGSARVEMGKVYVAGEEDVEQALKGFERFHMVTELATFLQALATEPVEIAANMIEGKSTGTAAGAATGGVKKLVEQIAKLNEFGEMRVICPQAHFLVQCVVTRECRKGYWVVTNHHLNIQMTPSSLPELYFPGDGPVQVTDQSEVNRVLAKFHSEMMNKNADAKRKMQQCEDSCGKE